MHVFNTSRHTVIRILPQGQKSRRAEVLPIVPEFAKWLAEQPRRTRYVCGFIDTASDMYVRTIGRNISRAANKLGLKITAHDLRRGFGARMALLVKPVVLARLMRHADIDTTMKYYANIDADDVADLLEKVC
jgi:integrase